ncbi:unnamed protein product [Microthlaspi erraticum]|uniref:F-box associated beta-propeller type 1 domain-containing protein n=1 Tax=Microthlaspi erraticum TaxID=1685480 RepID=A0A6D2J4F2_9BRAS|nr:unnamed protein product [Microthlaspi erraticum]
MEMDFKVCSVRFDLFKDEDKDKDDRGMVDLSVKHVALFDQVEICKVFYCKGLLLCVLKDISSLVAWNPYLGQTRWIKPRETFHRNDRYALGYDKKNRSHKILKFLDDGHPRNKFDYMFGYEIYDFSSDSWRVLDEKVEIGVDDIDLEFSEFENFLDRLAVPFHSYIDETVSLACVREEQLAVLYQRWDTLLEVMQIWVTTKIDPNSVSWSRFLKVDMNPLSGFQFFYRAASFFIDEEKKVAVVFDFDSSDNSNKTVRYNAAYIVGVDGYFKSVCLGEARDRWCRPLVCSSSYLPSLVQINNQRRKRKKRDV